MDCTAGNIRPTTVARPITFAVLLALLASAAANAQNSVDVTRTGLNFRGHARPIALADYGDAPDGRSARYPAPFQSVVGNFPTLYYTNNSRFGLPGAHTLDTRDAWLGTRISAELGPRDRRDPDRIENMVDDDLDDGMVGGPCPVGSPAYPFPNPLSATLAFDVTVDPNAPNVTRYINILIDLNHDGVWDSSNPVNTEWVVVDFPVNVTPGTTRTVTVSPFLLPLTPAGSWTRVALTRTPIVGSFTDDGSGWDGSGQFGKGEIEDYLLANALAHAQSAASASAWANASVAVARRAEDMASDFEFDVDGASDFALDISAALAAIDLSVEVQSAAAAESAAGASAAAASVSEATAEASAIAVADNCVSVGVSADSIAAACVTCPCATVCAITGASATAMVTACSHTSAYASATAASVAAASASASAQAVAASAAAADARASASAFAGAVAIAAAHADAIAVALADAQAAATAAATARANASALATSAASASATALSAACSGNAQAAAAAAASASAFAGAAASASVSALASAQASADALAIAEAEAFALAATYVEAEVSAEATAQTAVLALAAAGAGADAAASAAAGAGTSMDAVATSDALVIAISESFAAVSASCNGDCCPNNGQCSHTTSPDHYYDGYGGFSSVRTAAGVSSWSMVHVQGEGKIITGFTWQTVESDPSMLNGAADFAMWDSGTVQSGLADELNPVMAGFDLPVQIEQEMDCNQPVQLFGMPVMNFTVQLPEPIFLDPTQDAYFSVRGVGGDLADSFILTSHEDVQFPHGPSYFLSQSFGYPTAVPISELDGCDRDLVIVPITQDPGRPETATGGGSENRDGASQSSPATEREAGSAATGKPASGRKVMIK